MFKKILIANRGEIACRIIRSAQKMGIKTVAVFSDTDADTPHTHLADETVHIGPAEARLSYLNIEAVIEACKKTKAQAVHPGYGFLSENAQFVRALEENHITFIGPNTRAVQSMGDKIAARDIARKAGVAVVPGTENAIEKPQDIIREAQKIGYPVMIKAAAGGGGKGMRIVHKDEDVKENAERAISEAISSFGDGRVFVEKYITKPRHIEIQILADKHGNTLYLGERECSIQRRNQKIIEEAPSPFISNKKRKEMGECAVALAKSVQYDSAGTVEFIVDKNANFYFLEMNTRLQVEHPITELITGIDIVEKMIQVAAGEKLTLKQKNITINGAAIECRIYAEDPKRNFLPSTGRLTHYQPPQKNTLPIPDNTIIRIDDGVREGNEISPWYDPMIAKFCVHAPNRAQASNAMMHALNHFRITGIAHNLSFLNAVICHPKWINADTATDFIPEIWPEGYHARAEQHIKEKMIAVAVCIAVQEEKQIMPDPRTTQPTQHIRKAVRCGNEEQWTDVVTNQTENDTMTVILHKKNNPAAQYTLCGNRHFPFWSGTINDEPITMLVLRDQNALNITTMGAQEHILVTEPAVARLAHIIPRENQDNQTGDVRSPMPGVVISVSVKKGQKVEQGDVLCIVEAMKMENIIRAEKNGTIDNINIKPGDLIASDQNLLHIK